MDTSVSFLPKKFLLQLNSYNLVNPPPTQDHTKFDDYWLSFVLSHKLRVPMWKIQKNDIFCRQSVIDKDKDHNAATLKPDKLYA